MAALCRTRAVAAESHFLRVFLFSRPFRGVGTEGGSDSGSSTATEPKTRLGGFASALERQSELLQKVEPTRVRGSRGNYANDAVGEAWSRGGAWRRKGSRGPRPGFPELRWIVAQPSALRIRAWCFTSFRCPFVWHLRTRPGCVHTARVLLGLNAGGRVTSGEPC